MVSLIAFRMLLAAGNWTDLLRNATPPVTLPLDGPTGFYRIVGR